MEKITFLLLVSVIAFGQVASDKTAESAKLPAQEELEKNTSAHLLRGEVINEFRMNWAGDSGVALVYKPHGGGLDYSCLVVATKRAGKISARRCCESLQAPPGAETWISKIGQPDFMIPVLAVEQAMSPAGPGDVVYRWTAVNVDTGAWVAENARFRTACPVTINAGWKDGPVSGCWVPDRGCIIITQSGGVTVEPGMHESASATVPRVEFTQLGDSTIVAKSKDWKSDNEETIKSVLSRWAAAKFDREFTVKLEK